MENKDKACAGGSWGRWVEYPSNWNVTWNKLEFQIEKKHSKTLLSSDWDNDILHKSYKITRYTFTLILVSFAFTHSVYFPG